MRRSGNKKRISVTLLTSRVLSEGYRIKQNAGKTEITGQGIFVFPVRLTPHCAIIKNSEKTCLQVYFYIISKEDMKHGL